MIARLTGHIHPLGLDQLILDVHGVGYHVHVPVGTAGRLEPDGEGRVTLCVHTSVREDAIQLFGFADEREKVVFTRLTTVSGIGPRTGLNVLSELTVAEIIRAVQADDIAQFTRVSGIGKKTAQRLLLELKNAFADIALAPAEPRVAATNGASGATAEDLRSGLLNMGYKNAHVDSVVAELEPMFEEANDLETLFRAALKLLK